MLWLTDNSELLCLWGAWSKQSTREPKLLQHIQPRHIYHYEGEKSKIYTNLKTLQFISKHHEKQNKHNIVLNVKSSMWDITCHLFMSYSSIRPIFSTIWLVMCMQHSFRSFFSTNVLRTEYILSPFSLAHAAVPSTVPVLRYFPFLSAFLLPSLVTVPLIKAYY